jgi:hypothetical protein
LATAAIVLWNTAYLERAIQAIKDYGETVDENRLQHISPLGWEHINLTGDYVWRQTRRAEKRKFTVVQPCRCSSCCRAPRWRYPAIILRERHPRRGSDIYLSPLAPAVERQTC